VAVLIRWRRLRLALLLVPAFVAGAGAQAGLEYEVKAAFLYNFMRFVEWPSESPRVEEPFRVCLAGDDPFGGGLERTIGSDQIDGRPIVVERVPIAGVSARCQIVFVPNSQTANAAAVLRALGTSPVLTVGESSGFLQAGGMVNLIVEAGHVRFDVNVAPATARGLKISSKLLRIARRTSGLSEDREH
jgi:hypothetical protein